MVDQVRKQRAIKSFRDMQPGVHQMDSTKQQFEFLSEAFGFSLVLTMTDPPSLGEASYVNAYTEVDFSISFHTDIFGNCTVEKSLAQ